MKGIEIVNAQIEKTFLGIEDHGCFGGGITFRWGGSGQGFGIYLLSGPTCADWIKGVISAVGVYQWEELVGKYARIDREHKKIHRIGHITEDRWFDPSDLEWEEQ